MDWIVIDVNVMNVNVTNVNVMNVNVTNVNGDFREEKGATDDLNLQMN